MAAWICPILLQPILQEFFVVPPSAPQSKGVLMQIPSALQTVAAKDIVATVAAVHHAVDRAKVLDSQFSCQCLAVLMRVSRRQGYENDKHEQKRH